jgi:hypothetical protein
MKNFKLYWRLPIGLYALLVAGSGQTVMHPGEAIFVITVHGGDGVRFSGSYLVTGTSGESRENKVEGVVPSAATGRPREYTAVGTGVYLSFQNQTPGKDVEVRIDANGNRQLDQESPLAKAGPFLEVEISKDGTTIRKQRTDAPHGVITLASAEPLGGKPIQSEYEVNGSVKFAMLTLTSEAGDIEQQLVPIPFKKEFYPREGWAVGISAQKIRVTRPDFFSPAFSPTLEVLDDGVKGSVHVEIRVNGGVLGAADASEPFGVASTTVRIP